MIFGVTLESLYHSKNGGKKFSPWCSDSGSNLVSSKPAWSLAMVILYHATSNDAAEGIQQKGFRCGDHGFAGGAIYFSKHPEAACRKYRNGRGNPDILIKCNVNLGKCYNADKNEVDRVPRGFDSVTLVCLAKNVSWWPSCLSWWISNMIFRPLEVSDMLSHPVKLGLAVAATIATHLQWLEHVRASFSYIPKMGILCLDLTTCKFSDSSARSKFSDWMFTRFTTPGAWNSWASFPLEASSGTSQPLQLGMRSHSITDQSKMDAFPLAASSVQLQFSLEQPSARTHRDVECNTTRIDM